MKRFLTIRLILLTSCNQLDKKTENKVDKILASDNFEFFTFQVNCMYNNKVILTKDNHSNLIFRTDVDNSIIKTYKYTDDKRLRIKDLLKKGYSKDQPLDTGPGSMNRFYLLWSSTDTVSFFNNNTDIYEMFLDFSGLKATT